MWHALMKVKTMKGQTKTNKKLKLFLYSLREREQGGVGNNGHF
jgi:hypothetical protein